MLGFLVELIFDIVIEGTVQLGTDKKVPMPLRVLLLFVSGLIYGAVIGAFAMVAIGCWKRGETAAAIFVFAVDVVLILLLVHMVRKKQKENRENEKRDGAKPK